MTPFSSANTDIFTYYGERGIFTIFYDDEDANGVLMPAFEHRRRISNNKHIVIFNKNQGFCHYDSTKYTHSLYDCFTYSVMNSNDPRRPLYQRVGIYLGDNQYLSLRMEYGWVSWDLVIHR